MKDVMISKIEETSDKIYSFWNDIKNNKIEQLKSTWDDSISNEYIRKINSIDKTVNEIIIKLDNLKKYWENYEEEQPIVEE